jgi:hypothetical protein
MSQEEKTKKIRELNDQFRTTFYGGRVVMTQGVNTLEPIKLKALLLAVQQDTSFEKANDPYEEHDFSKILFDGEDYLWKIDYYDLKLEYGSEDPSDSSKTTRVLTIMKANEY